MVTKENSGDINRSLFTGFKTALMAESPDASRPDQPNASSSSSSNGAALQPPTAAGGDDKATTPIEKTISCVSCRKRKLKCDRTKPKCGTCSRLRHDCEYPERRRNLGSKRRNMKELEARLAQVETQLVAESSKNTPPKDNTPPTQQGEPDWNNYPMDINMDFDDDPLLDFPIPEPAYTFQPQIPNGDFFSQEVISLGLQEPLPPDEMVDDLHQLYFEKFHSTMPMVHKNRYLAALHLPAHMRPPICLRYAIWATAASISDKYSQYDDMLYERARRYIEQAEMKGLGETFVTIPHAQAWGLISTYEARKTYFTRAWMSTGRMVRLCQMLGLHSLDGNPSRQDAKNILPPPKDWIELEERRRTFWSAFYGDRWASSGTGWPMVIDEKAITTHLPASEEAFERGDIETSISLQDALIGEGVSKITPFGGVVLSACLFGHNFVHLHTYGPDERPEDLSNGEFWKRHRKMDNVLSNTFMFLPDHLRLPGGLRDMNIVFLHMNIHASAICLHQAAVLTAEQNKISQTFIRQSRARSLMAAEEIANIMRLISHCDTSNMNSWMGFCLYVASGVFIQDLRSKEKSLQSVTSLEFLISAMKAIGKRHSITQHFTAQVELDIENSGIQINIEGPASKMSPLHKEMTVPGLLPNGRMESSVHQLCPYNAVTQLSQNKPADWDRQLARNSRPVLGIFPTELSGQVPEDGVQNLTIAKGYHYGITPPTRMQNQRPQENADNTNMQSSDTQIPKPNDPATPFDINGFQAAVLSRFIEDEDSPDTQNSASSASGSATTPAWYASTAYPFEIDGANSQNPVNAPDSEQSTTAKAMAADGVMSMRTFLNGNPSNFTQTQYPYRQGDSRSHNKTPYGMFSDGTNDTNATENDTQWAFDPRMPTEICTNECAHPDTQPLFQTMNNDWNGDLGPK